MEIITPIVTAGKKTILYENPDVSITRVSLSDVNLPTVIKVPTRQANGAESAITEGKEYIINNTTWKKGTCFSNTSLAKSSI